jgi:hypothetical protein
LYDAARLKRAAEARTPFGAGWFGEERLMAEEERLADDAVVVRCGLPPFVDSPLDRGCRHHPDGFFGFSVQAAVGLTVEQLATVCRNKRVGFTTVAKIRIMGYEVVRTSGEAHHATVVVPEDWSADAAAKLAAIFEQADNPAYRKRQRP